MEASECLHLLQDRPKLERDDSRHYLGKRDLPRFRASFYIKSKDPKRNLTRLALSDRSPRSRLSVIPPGHTRSQSWTPVVQFRICNPHKISTLRIVPPLAQAVLPTRAAEIHLSCPPRAGLQTRWVRGVRTHQPWFCKESYAFSTTPFYGRAVCTASLL